MLVLTLMKRNTWRSSCLFPGPQSHRTIIRGLALLFHKPMKWFRHPQYRDLPRQGCRFSVRKTIQKQRPQKSSELMRPCRGEMIPKSFAYGSFHRDRFEHPTPDWHRGRPGFATPESKYESKLICRAISGPAPTRPW